MTDTPSTRRRSTEERLEQLNQKMEQLKAQKQRIQSQINQKERKARTRRLIQIGAIFENYFGVSSVEEAEEIAKTFQLPVQSHLKKKNPNPQDPDQTQQNAVSR